MLFYRRDGMVNMLDLKFNGVSFVGSSPAVGKVNFIVIFSLIIYSILWTSGYRFLVVKFF
jgi:hypothetical protein